MKKKQLAKSEVVQKNLYLESELSFLKTKLENTKQSLAHNINNYNQLLLENVKWQEAFDEKEDTITILNAQIDVLKKENKKLKQNNKFFKLEFLNAKRNIAKEKQKIENDKKVIVKKRAEEIMIYQLVVLFLSAIIVILASLVLG
jgi:regulator of replication initiation timing